MNIVTVLAIVEDGNTVAALGNIRILVSADLKLRSVPGCVEVSGALDRSVLNFVGGAVGVDINGEYGLDHLVRLMPVGNGFKIDLHGAVGKPGGLGDY